MSFFWEDEDDQAPLSQSIFHSSQQQGEFVSDSQPSNFHCHFCDSTECYVDETTDRQVCANCHTESQPSQSQAMDYEEVVGLAAKTHGSIRLLKLPKRKPTGQSDAAIQQQNFEELDQSVPLPDLETCILGFQTVLFHAMERLLDLLQWERHTDRRKQAHLLLRTLWADYLSAWKQGAEEYAQLFPHVRFALRDAFLYQATHKSMISKTLSYRALKRARQQLKQASHTKGLVFNSTQNNSNNNNTSHDQQLTPESSALRKRPHPDSALSSQPSKSHEEDGEDSDQSDDDGDDSTNSTSSSSSEESDSDTDSGSDDDADAVQVATKRRRLKQWKMESKIAHVIRLHKSGKPKAFTDVALHPTCKPSMKLAAALLWLTVYRAGVTSSQMCRWIRSGSLPLMSAFPLLNNEERRALRPIRYFFQMKRPFSLDALEYAATLLAAACRLRDTPELVVRENRAVKPRPRFITAKSLPRLLAQSIADMGLNQGVLYRCLVLLGLLPLDFDGDASTTSSDGEAEEFTQGSPLSADQVTRLEELAALIAIACFMDPHWREWRYGRFVHQQPTSDRSIPSTQQELHWIGNGPRLSNYVDYLEEIILCEEESYVPSFVEVLRKHNQSRRQKPEIVGSEESVLSLNDNEHGRTAIRPYPYVAGVPLKNMVDPGVVIIPSVDPQKKLLVEFVSHCVGATPSQVDLTIRKFLS